MSYYPWVMLSNLVTKKCKYSVIPFFAVCLQASYCFHVKAVANGINILPKNFRKFCV